MPGILLSTLRSNRIRFHESWMNFTPKKATMKQDGCRNKLFFIHFFLSLWALTSSHVTAWFSIASIGHKSVWNCLTCPLSNGFMECCLLPDSSIILYHITLLCSHFVWPCFRTSLLIHYMLERDARRRPLLKVKQPDYRVFLQTRRPRSSKIRHVLTPFQFPRPESIDGAV